MLKFLKLFSAFFKSLSRHYQLILSLEVFMEDFPSPKPNTALISINRQLALAGCPEISPATLYRIRGIYMELFPKSKWRYGDRLLYADSVVRVLYFLIRIHQFSGRFAMTRSLAIAELNRIKPAKISDRFKSFSDINTHFEGLNNA